MQSSMLKDVDMGPFLAQYVAYLPTWVQRLGASVSQQNVAEARRLLHEMKGTASLYGFAHLTEASARAEATLIAAQAITAGVAKEVQSVVELVRSVDGYDRAGETPLAT